MLHQVIHCDITQITDVEVVPSETYPGSFQMMWTYPYSCVPTGTMGSFWAMISTEGGTNHSHCCGYGSPTESNRWKHDHPDYWLSFTNEERSCQSISVALKINSGNYSGQQTQLYHGRLSGNPVTKHCPATVGETPLADTMAAVCHRDSICGRGPWAVHSDKEVGHNCYLVRDMATDWRSALLYGFRPTSGTRAECENLGGILGPSLTCGNVQDFWSRNSAPDMQSDTAWFFQNLEKPCSLVEEYRASCCERVGKCIKVSESIATQHNAVRCAAHST